MNMLLSCRFLSLLALLVATPAIEAQNRGQYILGSAGLNAGLQLPPGFSAGAFYIHYVADELKDAEGESVPVLDDFTLQGTELLLAYTTPWRMFGATYGASLVLFYMKGSVSLERFDASASRTGFADSYFEPVNLGWQYDRAAFKAAYGFIAPTGAEGVTTDYFGHDITLAGTFFLDDLKLSQISLNSVTEFHQRKRDTDVTVGDNTQLEFAAGRLIPLSATKLLQLGLVGYGQWQFSDDSGDDTIPLLADQQDRVWALGGEIGYVLPKSEWSFLLRGEHEFAARSRGEGWTVITGFLKSF